MDKRIGYIHSDYFLNLTRLAYFSNCKPTSQENVMFKDDFLLGINFTHVHCVQHVQ